MRESRRSRKNEKLITKSCTFCVCFLFHFYHDVSHSSQKSRKKRKCFPEQENNLKENENIFVMRFAARRPQLVQSMNLRNIYSWGQNQWNFQCIFLLHVQRTTRYCSVHYARWRCTWWETSTEARAAVLLLGIVLISSGISSCRECTAHRRSLKAGLSETVASDTQRQQQFTHESCNFAVFQGSGIRQS